MVASKIANFLNPRPKMPALILNPRRKIKSNNICCLSVFYLLTSLGDQKSSIIAPHQREARSGWTETDCKSRQAAANERPRLVQSWQSDQWEACRDLFQITVGWGGSSHQSARDNLPGSSLLPWSSCKMQEPGLTYCSIGSGLSQLNIQTIWFNSGEEDKNQPRYINTDFSSLSDTTTQLIIYYFVKHDTEHQRSVSL